MTAEEQTARLRSIDIAEEAQMVVIWSCFTTEEDKEAAIVALDKLRADRWELLEMELSGVIENTKEQSDLSDPEEIKLLGLLRDLMFFDDMSYDIWRAFCLQVAALGKPVDTLTLGELAALAPRRKSA